MNWLQKKCVIVSTGFHLLLALILVVGPGFFAPKNVMEDVQTITIIPDNISDTGSREGGSNNKPSSAPPPPPPPPHIEESKPTPKPTELKHHEPEPVKLEKQEDHSFELAKDKKPKIEISTKTVTRPRNDAKSTQKKDTSESDVRARELADAQAKRDVLLAAANTLRGSVGSSTTIENPTGGGFGEAVATYAQLVKSRYEGAWLPPEDATNENAITKVSVTILHDGTVSESSIVRQSGDSLVDHSVQRTLDRVKISGIGRPFSEGSKDKQRTYIINFNLKAKKGLG